MTKNCINTDLTGKIAVVTGAGGVLCSAFAKVLASAGAKVALLDLNEASIKSAEEEITKEKGIAKAYVCDVLNKGNCKTVAQSIQKEWGDCHILINGAGGNHKNATTQKEYYFNGDEDSDVKTFFDLDTQGVDFVFQLNFMGTLIPTQVFAKQMLNQKGCCIINISSMNAFTPLTKIPAYSGAKSAISNFTKWLAVHFSKVGIRVNAIAPGFFLTKQNEELLFNKDKTPTQRTDKILAATPMGRLGEPKELEGALLFLLNNEAASFITGIVLCVDGGFSAYSGV